MTKHFKYTKAISRAVVLLSMVLFSPDSALANTPPIIIDSIDQIPIIEDDDHFNFIRPVLASEIVNHNNFPIIIFDDPIHMSDIFPNFIIIDYMPLESIPELMIEIEKSQTQNMPTPPIIQNIFEHTSRVELVHWHEVRNFLPIGETIQIHDILSGLTYNVQSLSNGAHADVEPVTANDTAIMLMSLGGEWSWTPRPVWVVIGDRIIAASINGFPHDIYTIPDNNMDGHVCLHFYGSTTHNNNLAFAQLHQDALIEAYNMARERIQP